MTIAALSTQFAPLWSSEIRVIDSGDTCQDIAIDHHDATLLLSSWSGKLQVAEQVLQTPRQRNDIYALKLDAHGVPLWLQIIPGDVIAMPIGVSAAPDDAVSVAGATMASLDAPASVFLAKLAPGTRVRSELGSEWTQNLAAAGNCRRLPTGGGVHGTTSDPSQHRNVSPGSSSGRSNVKRARVGVPVRSTSRTSTVR